MPFECKLPDYFAGIGSLSNWIEETLGSTKEIRCIVLLDDFEELTTVSRLEFDAQFFRSLRYIACCEKLLYRFIWVTCSYCEWTIHSPCQKENDKCSPFSNIFLPNPIIIGGLGKQEATQLINKSSKDPKFAFSPEEIVAIQNIAGPLPYFLQVVANQWSLAKKENLPIGQCSQIVITKLLYSNSPVDNLFWIYWNRFTKEERDYLLKVAQRELPYKIGKQIERRFTEIKFLKYGLLKKDGDSLNIAGELFRTWILVNGQGDVNMIPLIKRIEEIKNSVNDLESRKTELTNARAKLNKVTQMIEFLNYTEQITEIESTIEAYNKEVYTKREELLSLILGESGRIELIISKIEENLPHLSAEQIDAFLSQIVQLKAEIEEIGFPVPCQLIDAKPVTEKSYSSDDEKRAKVKLSLSLLGPKIEIEKTIADPNVREMWRNFWKKAKEIALKEVF